MTRPWPQLRAADTSGARRAAARRRRARGRAAATRRRVQDLHGCWHSGWHGRRSAAGCCGEGRDGQRELRVGYLVGGPRRGGQQRSVQLPPALSTFCFKFQASCVTLVSRPARAHLSAFGRHAASAASWRASVTRTQSWTRSKSGCEAINHGPRRRPSSTWVASASPGRGHTGVYFNFRFSVCLQLTKKVFKTQAEKPKKRENLQMKRRNSKS